MLSVRIRLSPIAIEWQERESNRTNRVWIVGVVSGPIWSEYARICIMLSLETCQKLKEAGWPQDIYTPTRDICEFGWFQRVGDGSPYIHYYPMIAGQKYNLLAICPTLEELLEAITSITPNFQIESGRGGDGQYWIRAWAEPTNPVTPNADAVGNNIAEVVAALWLKLKGAKDA